MKSTKQLPARAELGQLRKQAKELLSAWRGGSGDALSRAQACLARYAPATAPVLADAQLVIAREYGFPSWAQLRRRVEAIDLDDPVTAFTEAATAPLTGSSHASGDLERAEAIRAQHPDRIGRDVFTAAILGDAAAVDVLLAGDRALAVEAGGLYDWDPLTYLCFSRYLRLDAARASAFVRTARLLLDNGASAHTGFYWQDHEPEPTLETAIYGAAAVARRPELTRLLLERGADPNDGETPYHVGEGWDNAALEVLVESGKLDHDGVAMILHRKLDWHDHDGIKWLLQHGSDVNRISRWGKAAIHHAVLRDNAMPIVELLLEHGADPTLLAHGKSAIALAARGGRGDVLDAIERRGFPIELDGLDAVLAACARNDGEWIRSLVGTRPEVVGELLAEGGALLAEFAAIGNTNGVRRLLDLGIPVATTCATGDGYLGYANDSTPLHVAAWLARHETVELLLERGAPVSAVDAAGKTPLALAVRACIDSHWTHRRSPESVRALLQAGANAEEVDRFPSGYAEIDVLLEAKRGAGSHGVRS